MVHMFQVLTDKAIQFNRKTKFKWRYYQFFEIIHSRI